MNTSHLSPFFFASIATTIHWDPNFFELSITTFEFSTAAVLIETLSAPQLSNLFISSTLLIPPPTVKGTKQSPNFEETAKVAEISNCPVIISGGVSSIDDIKKAKSLKNIEGIIIGKAIYDGDIKLEELAKEIDA